MDKPNQLNNFRIPIAVNRSKTMEYEMKIKLLFFTVAALLLLSDLSFAQSDIEIFGFYQVRLTRQEGGYTIKAALPPALGGITKKLSGIDQNFTSPYVQDLNLMFRKEFSPKVSTFMNFELVNNFSTEKEWGSFNLQEIWLEYEYTQDQSIKAGLLVPKFNNLNEIKNRMPLLPYIIRPIIYEPAYSTILNPSDFLPERAFVQLQGKFYNGDLELNYAAYAGPSDDSYTVSGINVGAAVTGTDTTNFKLFGGRLGVNYQNIRLGVSTSFDKHNMMSTIKENVNRKRLGIDLGASLYGFTLDGEYIKVMLDPKNTTQDLNKLFYYGTLSYDFTNQIFAFGSYSYIENNENPFFKDGVKNLSFGGGFRASDNIVVKAQYTSMKMDGNMPVAISPALPPLSADTNLDIKLYSLAVSVLF